MFRSNCGSFLLSFRDMTTGWTTYDGNNVRLAIKVTSVGFSRTIITHPFKGLIKSQTAVLFKSPLATARAASCNGPVHLFVCLSVCLSPKYKKTRFSQKLSILELWSLLTTYKKSYMGFSKNPLLDH